VSSATTSWPFPSHLVVRVGSWLKSSPLWMFAILFTGALHRIGAFIAGCIAYQWRVSLRLVPARIVSIVHPPSGYADPGGDPAWLNSRLRRAIHGSRTSPIIYASQLFFGIVLAIGLYVAWIIAFFAFSHRPCLKGSASLWSA